MSTTCEPRIRWLATRAARRVPTTYFVIGDFDGDFVDDVPPSARSMAANPIGTTHTTAIVNAECDVPFRWTADTLGWKGTSEGRAVTMVVTRVRDTATPGQLVPLHVGTHPRDHSTHDDDALPQVIDGLWQRSPGFITRDTALGSAPLGDDDA